MACEAGGINVSIGCRDEDSMIVVLRHLADLVSVEATEMTACDDFVVERLNAAATIIGLYPATKDENLEEFEAGRRKNRRQA